jgi:predicted DNA-binding protein YlxM (UPF0122 family)
MGDMFLPIQVGKSVSNTDLGFISDNTGDNISEKNKSFCELTALYWAWKNIDTVYPGLEYIGLCHYRRYLAVTSHFPLGNKIILSTVPVFNNYSRKLVHLLKKYQFLLPKKDIYKYSLFVDYSVCHYSEDYRVIKTIVHDLYPDYDKAFFHVFECNNKLSHYNIFITHKHIFNDYCEWLFKILFEVEKRINIKNYNEYQQRIFGFLGERLLNVYVYHHNFKVKYKPVLLISDSEKDNYLINLMRNIRNRCSFFIQNFSIYNLSHK